MASALYVCLQDEDKIVSFAIDPDSGRLTHQAEVAVSGGPSVLAISPDRRTLYLGCRTNPALSSYRIDHNTGALSPQGAVTTEHAPTFLATDRTGRYLLSAYYQGAYAAVHPLAADGGVSASAVDRKETANGAHAIQTDRSNRFAFVPHIARLNDNVLEPPRDNPGPNVIFQFRFDAQTGRLTPNSPLQVAPLERVGPRHLCFHPNLDLVYFSNEQGCSVSSYRLDPGAGTLAAAQTITTLPEGYTARNTCSQIHLTPSGQLLYVANRGHNSIAGFRVDAAGRLTPVGHASTEPVPSAFCLDPAGRFVFAAGSASGRLASYRIDGETGVLTSLATYDVGRRPQAVLATALGS
jgi:6-phosphogluconolactonase